MVAGVVASIVTQLDRAGGSRHARPSGRSGQRANHTVTGEAPRVPFRASGPSIGVFAQLLRAGRARAAGC